MGKHNLKELGFKQKWLEDKSGYWWEKRMNKYFYYLVEEGKYYELVFKNELERSIKFKNLKKLLKSIDKFKFEY